MVDTKTKLKQKLVDQFIDRYPDEAVEKLVDTGIEKGAELLETISSHRTVQLFERLTPMNAADFFERMSEEKVLDTASKMNPSLLARVFSQMDEEKKNALLESLEPHLKKEISDLLAYPKGTAGSVMDSRVMTFSPEQTVREVISHIRPFREQKVHTVYIVDQASHLTGLVPLQEAILAKPSTKMKDLMISPVSVHVMAPKEEAVDLFTKLRLTSLPVVDLDGVLLGVMRQEAAFKVLEQDATANIQTMVGAGRDERALSSPLFSVKKRLPWLNINLLTAFVAAAVVGLFENTIAQVTALAILLPVVAGQSGNTGAQALAVTMRGLALREVQTRHWPQLVLKETIAGFLNGVAIAIVTGLGVLLWSHSVGLAAVISVAMVIAMSIAGAAGASIPIVLTSLGQDPAQSSSIILTTVTDVFGFLSFLGLATLFISFL